MRGLRPTLGLQLTLVVTICVICLGTLSCAKKNDETPAELLRRQIRLAYSLMDKGDNSSALILLEDLDRKHPNSGEVRTLLASAYLGRAGLDVYQIHDRFKDILFEKSLSDSFWKAGAKKPESRINPEDLLPTVDAPIKNLVSRTDVFLSLLQQFAGLLNRFPPVPSEKWPLLDTALERLETIPHGDQPETSDIRLYRIFVRVVYLKAFLDERFLNDQSFGTKQWACAFEWNDLRSHLLWIEGHLHRITVDFQAVFPKRDSPLAWLEREVLSLTRELDAPATYSDAYANSGVTDVTRVIGGVNGVGGIATGPRGNSVVDFGVRSTVREAFRCR